MTRILALIVLAILTAASTAGAATFDPFAAVAIETPPVARAPLDGTFRDEAGRPVSLRSLADGRPIVLAPVLHNCPNICGVTLGALSDAVALQPSEPDFAVVGFGIDPREKPADAAAALAVLADREGGANGTHPIHALTGEAGEVHAVTDALGYRYAFDPDLGQYAHAAAIAVLTPEGRVVRWLPGLAPDPQELGRAIADAREGQVASLRETLLLMCYHYDPVTGRYTLLVSRIVQISGVATVLALAGLVGFSIMRERRRGGGAR